MALPRPGRRALDGVLLLDKACGASSNAELQQAKRLYRAAKAGHAGTLDPLASGLLPVLFGEATKFSADLLDADKAYTAEITLGVTTTTADAEGEIVASCPVAVSAPALHDALATFRGEIQQTPPLYSALKRDGKPLYAYARAGVEVERAARTVTIHALDLLWFEGVRLGLNVKCSKGTYIRALAQDLGAVLGCGAHLSALRRTAVARFGVTDALGLEALSRLGEAERDARLLPVDALLQSLGKITLDAAQASRFSRGQAIGGRGEAQGRVRVYDGRGQLVGVGEIDAAGTLAPKRLLAQAAA